MNASLSAICIGLLVSSGTSPDKSKPNGPVIEQIADDQFRVTFRFVGDASTKSVSVAGTFNGWRPDRDALHRKQDHGPWQATVQIPRGRHEYKFVINADTWVTDPGNPDRVGPHENAVLMVGVELAPWGEMVAAMAPATNETNVTFDFSNELQMLAVWANSMPEEVHLSFFDAWLTERRMPIFQGGHATFAVVDQTADEVRLLIDGGGFWRQYPLPAIVGAGPMFIVALPVERVQMETTYRYAIRRGDDWSSILDPRAWTVTSRAGRPVSLVAMPSPNRGRIELITDIVPTARVIRRDVYVYLPPGYDDHPQQRYPVIYMHDGQNCWDDPHEPFGHGGWHVNTTADRLVAESKIEPTIIVGVPNTADRLHELFPKANLLCEESPPYMQYLLQNVKPAIDARYRTRRDAASTFVMGSSLGGCMSFYAAIRQPDVFGAAACLSSAFAYSDDKGQTYVDLVKKLGKQPVRIYLDSGTSGPGRDGLEATQQMRRVLIELGWQEGQDLQCIRDEGAEHNERYWRARVHRPLEFLLGSGESDAINQPTPTSATKNE